MVIKSTLSRGENGNSWVGNFVVKEKKSRPEGTQRRQEIGISQRRVVNLG